MDLYKTKKKQILTVFSTCNEFKLKNIIPITDKLVLRTIFLPNYDAYIFKKEFPFPLLYYHYFFIFFFSMKHTSSWYSTANKLAITKAVKQLFNKILIQLCTVLLFLFRFSLSSSITNIDIYTYVLFFCWLLLPFTFFYSIDIEFLAIHWPHKWFIQATIEINGLYAYTLCPLP